jgi:superfamily I DNA/RNA helicase
LPNGVPSKQMTILLDTSRGCITAPAGTGKTFLLAETVKAYRGNKPLLVLTHTNAGVQVLRKRLEDAHVSRKFYTLSTIDGLALQLVRTFPLRAECKIELKKICYPELRVAAVRLLEQQHLDAVLRANFARVLVDEYQDCESMQHRFVCALASLLPTCILGDPLQRIFNFKGAIMPTWEAVQSVFTDHHALAEPMRWIRAGNGDLGHWLLGLRPALLKREPISIDGAPNDGLIYLPMPASPTRGAPYGDFMPSVSALKGSTLIVGSSVRETSRHDLARYFPGASVVEPVEMESLLDFASRFDALTGRSEADNSGALSNLLDFAGSVMTGVQSAAIAKRVVSIEAGRNTKAANAHEELALRFSKLPSCAAASDLLSALKSQKGARLFRPQVFHLCRTALAMVAEGRAEALLSAAAECRERNRHYTAHLPKIAIGSTLLLKGLEADNVFIQDADGVSAENLYVALTRGSKKIVLRSRLAVITPH